MPVTEAKGFLSYALVGIAHIGIYRLIRFNRMNQESRVNSQSEQFVNNPLAENSKIRIHPSNFSKHEQLTHCPKNQKLLPVKKRKKQKLNKLEYCLLSVNFYINFHKAKLLHFVQLDDCIKILHKSVFPTLKIFLSFFLISDSPPSGCITFCQIF